MRKLLLALLAGILVLAAICLGRALTARSRQIAPSAAAVPKLDRDALASHLGAALRFRTTQGEDAQLQALQAWLRDTFPRAHAVLSRETIGRRGLLYVWKGTVPALAPALYLAHLDVVPASNDWTHPPFAGDVADGFIWGRGAIDDKGSAVGLFEAIEALLASGFAPRRSLYLALGGDEEVGGVEGAMAIAQALRARGLHFSSVLDEGLALTRGVLRELGDRPLATIGLAEKGYLSVELTVQGRGGHSSVPPPQTAAGVVAAAVDALERHPFPLRATRTLRSMIDGLGPELPLARRLAFGNFWLFQPVLLRALAAQDTTGALVRTTTAPTMLEGSATENVLPQRARAVVNFRILPGETTADVLAHVTSTVADPRVEVRALEHPHPEPSAESSERSPRFVQLAATVRQIFPSAVVAPGLVVGTTDERHYEGLADDAYRFQPMVWTPEDIARIHGKDERIAVEGYFDVVGFYAALIGQD